MLDADFFADPASADLLEPIMLHELGHVVGLDHVADPDEVMNDLGVLPDQLGPGDRTGLALVGRGPCINFL